MLIAPLVSLPDQHLSAIIVRVIEGQLNRVVLTIFTIRRA